MSVGTGIECINLKKAKYNRDMKRSVIKEFDKTSEYNAVPTEISSEKSRRSHIAEAYPDGVADVGYSFKDAILDILAELFKAFHTYRKKRATTRANTPKYVQKKVKTTAVFPVSVIGYIIVFSVIAMFLVLGNSKINEARLYGSSLENQIGAEINKCEMLSAEINAKNDGASVEDYAINVLGLVKKTDVAKTYVSISGEDKVVVKGVSGGTVDRAPVTMTLSSGK